MQTQLRSRLLADSTISTNCLTRVDWNVRPQGKPLPAITLFLPNDVRDQHMGGLQTTRGPEVQVDVWAETASMAATLREAVITLLATGAVQDGVTFFAAQDIRASNMVEQVGDKIIHREMIRAAVWHTVIP